MGTLQIEDRTFRRYTRPLNKVEITKNQHPATQKSAIESGLKSSVE